MEKDFIQINTLQLRYFLQVAHGNLKKTKNIEG